MTNSGDIGTNVKHLLQNSQTSDSLQIIKKMKTYNLGKFSYMSFLGGISALHINFQKIKNLNRRGAVRFWKKQFVLSDLTPDVRSYPVLRYNSQWL